jgi:hypothetical protein
MSWKIVGVHCDTLLPMPTSLMMMIIVMYDTLHRNWCTQWWPHYEWPHDQGNSQQ